MNDMVITNQGHELIAKMIAGTSTATFTKIQTSSYDYSTETLENLTSLYDVKQEVLVSSVSRTDTVLVEVLAAVENTDLTEGYYVKALGLFAKDSDDNEILYAVAIDTENPDYMPEYGGKTVSGISYRLNTKVDKSEQVTIEVNPAATPTMEQVQEIMTEVTVHEIDTIYGETGIHGMRYFNEVLQVKNDEGKWVDIESGGGGISPNNVSDLKINVGNEKLTIFWSDPGDTIVEGQLLCTWKGTKLVQKAGSFPENAKDGTVICDNQTLDAYKTTGFEINGLVNGQTYFFALFPYADTGATNTNVANRISGTPQPFKKMTAIIDLSNSNPTSSVTYADDAVGMAAGSSDWDDFFGHYPVLLKDGVEVGKLQRNNFDKFEDGSTADISSGSAGDAMIAFPRRGLSIKTVGTKIYVSMTDDPDNADFEYNAHTRGTTAKDVFYLGVYKGYAISNKLRSLKGKAITTSRTIGTFRTQAQANGSGYEQSGFYQLTFRQVMFILKYKTLNSQSAVGMGYVLSTHNEPIASGGTEAWGMDCEEIKKTNPSYLTDQNHHVKCFGLEDSWGNIWEWIDGLVSDSSRNVLTANSEFNDSGSGYVNNGNGGVSSNVSGYMSKPQGSTKAGFVPKEDSGSESTYFCDFTYSYPSRVARHGGAWSTVANAGAFTLRIQEPATDSGGAVAARLMYL